MQINPDIRFFVTTKRLLKLTGNAEVVCADGTYKLNWNSYPLIVVGTADKERKNHPFGIGVSAKETMEDFAFMFQAIKMGAQEFHSIDFQPAYLMSDAAHAIGNGARATWPSIAIGMCWAHVATNLKKKLAIVGDKILAAKIKSDIYFLQTAVNEPEFNRLKGLLIQKWRNKSEGVDLFLDYFQREWLDKNCNWFEGFQESGISANNGLESNNRWIKEDFTFRERLPMNQFLPCLLRMVEAWSRDRLQGRHEWINDTTLVWKFGRKKLAIQTDAYQWATIHRNSASVIATEHDCQWLVYSKTDYGTLAPNNFSESDLRRFLKLPRFANIPQNAIAISHRVTANIFTFSSYVELVSKFRMVKVWSSGGEWNASCYCRDYLQCQYCKHSLGSLYLLGKLQFERNVTCVPLGQKRRRGRPKQVGEALSHE